MRRKNNSLFKWLTYGIFLVVGAIFSAKVLTFMSKVPVVGEKIVETANDQNSQV
ncbi:hypothetical protein [Tenacibaculum agarivorans]|uniref:hypothetical protein n=1 Tax=Tenacibaculum agarivorans TaxID=1908389 RepID=UPI000AF15195|nr:hypothetical protein [Tenacibaculum agarivorans]